MDILYSDISYINQHINLAGQATPVRKLHSYLWLPFTLGKTPVDSIPSPLLATGSGARVQLPAVCTMEQIPTC